MLHGWSCKRLFDALPGRVAGGVSYGLHPADNLHAAGRGWNKSQGGWLQTHWRMRRWEMDKGIAPEGGHGTDSAQMEMGNDRIINSNFTMYIEAKIEELKRENLQLQAIEPAKIRNLLVKHGIISHYAIDDPAGFDCFETWDAVNAFALELHEALFPKDKKDKNELRS